MAQMRNYGIPASITLAQGILESASGQSQLARKENNHFGIKATQSWINNGGKYGLYTDDKANEKFCSYASVGDSYEHHSKFLKNSSRYASCFKLQPNDYQGWANGLDRAGYATAGKYAPSLIKIIEQNDLDKIDQEVLAQMNAQGKNIGTEANPKTATNSNNDTQNNDYSFPLRRDEFMLITSPFGMRKDPLGSGKEMMHKGIDIKTNNDAILATESKGKVVSVNQNANTPGGKSITIEYQRGNGDKVQNSYLHLSAINVKIGDEVQAGQQLGVTGNTGTRTTGEHLHFSVKQISKEGVGRDIDPTAYLADIAQKGNIQLQAMSNGKDLLAKYKTQEDNDTNKQNNIPLSPDDWMKKLLSSEDSGVNMTQGDPITEMAITMFTSLISLATQIDKKSEQEKMQSATDAAISKRIDLSTLLPSLKSSALTIGENGRTTLEINNGKESMHHELTNAEQNRMSSLLNDNSLTDDVKKQKLGSLVNSIFTMQQVSQNYEQQANQNQTETIRR